MIVWLIRQPLQAAADAVAYTHTYTVCACMSKFSYILPFKQALSGINAMYVSRASSLTPTAGTTGLQSSTFILCCWNPMLIMLPGSSVQGATTTTAPRLLLCGCYKTHYY
jgi:hypothetical protein